MGYQKIPNLYKDRRILAFRDVSQAARRAIGRKASLMFQKCMQRKLQS